MRAVGKAVDRVASLGLQIFQASISRTTATRWRNAPVGDPASWDLSLKGMDCPEPTRACVAWLLCAILLCMMVHSPHCDRCDGPDFFASHPSPPLVHQGLPDAPDDCSGACWCCIFHGVPITATAIDQVDNVSWRVWPWQPSDVQAPRPSLFRPPRILFSS
jgi:hypothetical protein